MPYSDEEMKVSYATNVALTEQLKTALIEAENAKKKNENLSVPDAIKSLNKTVISFALASVFIVTGLVGFGVGYYFLGQQVDSMLIQKVNDFENEKSKLNDAARNAYHLEKKGFHFYSDGVTCKPVKCKIKNVNKDFALILK